MDQIIYTSGQRISLEQLHDARLTNDEIIDILASICSSESIEPYKKYINMLRDMYDMSLEIIPIDLKVLSLRSKFPMHSLANYFLAAYDVSIESLLMEFITAFQVDKSAVVYLKQLELIYSYSWSEKTLRDLLRYIKDSDMDGPGIDALNSYFTYKLSIISGYAETPKYIGEYEIKGLKNGEPSLPKLEKVDVKFITDEDLSKLLLDQISDFDIVIDNSECEELSQEELLTMYIRDLDPEDRNELAERVASISPDDINNIRANEDIFRVYGPVNPYNDTNYGDLDTNDPNIIYGGARMLTDKQREFNEDLEIYDDWFVGYCMYCLRRIRVFFHAVRIPFLTGGWGGCYCSWSCVTAELELAGGQEEDYNTYLATLSLVDEYKKLVDKVGIANRPYEEPYLKGELESQEAEIITSEIEVTGLPSFSNLQLSETISPKPSKIIFGSTLNVFDSE